MTALNRCTVTESLWKRKAVSLARHWFRLTIVYIFAKYKLIFTFLPLAYSVDS